MASVRAKKCLCHCEIIYLGSIYIEPSVPRNAFSGWQGGTIAVWATGSREILIIAGRRQVRITGHARREEKTKDCRERASLLSCR